MLKLFQSIFGGGENRGRYPDSLVEAAIERAVDGTDPRLRALPGYRKHLRAPVLHAIDHVVTLVDSLPAPQAASRSAYSNDPRLATLFASAEHMLEVLGHHAALPEFRASLTGSPEQITALLLAERVEKRVLGMELVGDILQREVAQVAVNFRAHRLVDPAASEEDTRRQLKRRAFDHLLSLALARITEVQGERANLNRQRTMLRRKLSALEQGGWNFEEATEARPDPASLQSELDEIEGQLAALGIDDRALRTHLEIAAALLADAERQFWAERIDLHLDPMNIQRDPQDASARQIQFQELRNARGRRVVMLLVSITPSELPQREDFMAAAKRYLG
jgi:hypothetical protein